MTIALQQFVIYTQVIHFIIEPEMVDKENNVRHQSNISLVAHMVKNPPTKQETLVQFLCQEDPLEKE